jgi:hypothetical protein
MLLLGVSSKKDKKGHVIIYDEQGDIFGTMCIVENPTETIFYIEVKKGNGQLTH